MPRIVPGRDARVLVTESMFALGLTQKRLGTLLMASRRTVSRWVSGRSTIGAPTLARLAVAVHPTNATLAARLAAESGQTLESLGLVAPLPAAPAPPRRAFPPVGLVADSVVCAAAEVMQAPPTVVREALRAAFARAQALDLSVEEMIEALSPPPAPSSSASPPKGAASGKRTSSG
jgi:transcriptional regulator with XRE-family HTH domain